MSCSLCGKFGEAAAYCNDSRCPRTGHLSSNYQSALPRVNNPTPQKKSAQALREEQYNNWKLEKAQRKQQEERERQNALEELRQSQINVITNKTKLGIPLNQDEQEIAHEIARKKVADDKLDEFVTGLLISFGSIFGVLIAGTLIYQSAIKIWNNLVDTLKDHKPSISQTLPPNDHSEKYLIVVSSSMGLVKHPGMISSSGWYVSHGLVKAGSCVEKYNNAVEKSGEQDYLQVITEDKTGDKRIGYLRLNGLKPAKAYMDKKNCFTEYNPF